MWSVQFYWCGMLQFHMKMLKMEGYADQALTHFGLLFIENKSYIDTP